MKKFLVLFAFYSLFLIVSCDDTKRVDNPDTGETVTDEDTADSGQGDTTPEQPDNEDSGRKQGELYGECYPNATCNKGLICDEESNICIKDPNSGDDDSTLEQPDDADSIDDSDTSDSTDSTDDTDSTDSKPDGDEDTTPVDPCADNPCAGKANSTEVCTADGENYTCGCDDGYVWTDSECFLLCSKDGDTPCKDLTSGLIWSKISQSSMNWNTAVTYCQGSKMNGYGGFTDWRLPTIDELKTLLTSATGDPSRSANCKVSETNGCLTWDGCWTCSTCTEQGSASTSEDTCSEWGTGYNDGRFSKLGDAILLWSSSTRTDKAEEAWRVGFDYGSVYSNNKSSSKRYVRCIRN